MGVNTFFLSFLSCLGYSWDIRGVFVWYSWDIRMYRVCVGYVSGMYREYIERYGEGKGFFDKLVERNIESPTRKAREILLIF